MRARSSLPGGTSETLGSRFYANLLPQWLTNESYPVRLRLVDLVTGTYSVTIYTPR